MAAQTGPAVAAADKAIETGSIEDVAKLLNQTVEKGLHERFHEVVGAKDCKKDNIEAGRRFVRAYVAFVHYVEPIYEAAGGAGATHEHGGKAG